MTSTETTPKREQQVESNGAQKGVLVHDMKGLRLRNLERPPLKYFVRLYDMFNKIDQRDPPAGNPIKTKHLRFITIRVSHYNEKARWALDFVDEDPSSPYYYTEDVHPPGFHAIESIRATKDTGSATPIVIDSKDGQIWIKSDTIVRTFCPQLYPNDDVKDMEDDLNNRLGPAVRTFAYSKLLNDQYFPELLKMTTGPECAAIENLLFPLMKNSIGSGLRKALQINDASVALSLATIQEIFASATKTLEKQSYLVDPNQFTAADLTFAALASPLMRPPELRAFQGRDENLPPDVMEFIRELRTTRAGQHALKMYREHRYPVGGPGGRVVRIKGAGRNRIPWMAAALVVGVSAAGVAAVMAADK
jgi:glutathione S-transferase